MCSGRCVPVARDGEHDVIERREHRFDERLVVDVGGDPAHRAVLGPHHVGFDRGEQGFIGLGIVERLAGASIIDTPPSGSRKRTGP